MKGTGIVLKLCVFGYMNFIGSFVYYIVRTDKRVASTGPGIGPAQRVLAQKSY